MPPAPLAERVATSLRLRLLDARDRVTGRADPLVPPRRLDFVGPTDFAATGDEFLGHFVRLAGLTPSDDVLDIGCGIGRTARPVVRHLGPEGSYTGFDVNAEGIAWCRERYAGHPNARFDHADLRNGRYNPAGAQDAAAFVFPYPDAAFDLALATSVFTHLLADEIARYVAQTVRVLRPGGRLLATFFLLDGAGADVVALDPAVPEERVGCRTAWVEGLLRRHGLTPMGVHRGSWAGHPDPTSFQDIVVARKEGPEP